MLAHHYYNTLLKYFPATYMRPDTLDMYKNKRS